MNKFTTPLKYDQGSLPTVSKDTMHYHYEKHYLGYCKNLAKIIKNTKYDDMELDSIVDMSAPLNTTPNSSNPIYNNAAQIKNHDFFFEQLTPTYSDLEDGELKNLIVSEYGSVDKLLNHYKTKLTSFFGVGWVWLTLEQHKQWDSPSIKVVATRDGNTFINHKSTEHFVGPICVLDVWEHSYYIDHKNDRSAYFDSIIQCIDWEIISQRFSTHSSTLFDYTKPFEL